MIYFRISFFFFPECLNFQASDLIPRLDCLASISGVIYLWKLLPYYCPISHPVFKSHLLLPDFCAYVNSHSMLCYSVWSEEHDKLLKEADSELILPRQIRWSMMLGSRLGFLHARHGPPTICLTEAQSDTRAMMGKLRAGGRAELGKCPHPP